VTKPDIQSFDDMRLREAIEASKQEHYSQRRMFPSGVPMSKKMREELDNQAANSRELKIERLSRKRRNELTPQVNASRFDLCLYGIINYCIYLFLLLRKKGNTRADVTAKTIRSSTRRRRVKISQNER